MKTKFFYSIIILLSLGLGACDSFYFEAPLPLDQKSLERFPADLQGHYQSDWFEDLRIGERQIEIIESDTSEIPLQLKNMGMVTRAGKLYLIDSVDQRVKGPFSFEKGPDKIRFWRKQKVVMGLDSRMTIRRCGKDYLLSHRDANDDWWQVILFTKNSEGYWQMKFIDKEALPGFSDLEVLYKSNGNSKDHYIIGDEFILSERSLKEMAQKGLFTAEDNEGVLIPID